MTFLQYPQILTKNVAVHYKETFLMGLVHLGVVHDLFTVSTDPHKKYVAVHYKETF